MNCDDPSREPHGAICRLVTGRGSFFPRAPLDKSFQTYSAPFVFRRPGEIWISQIYRANHCNGCQIPL